MKTFLLSGNYCLLKAVPYKAYTFFLTFSHKKWCMLVLEIQKIYEIEEESHIVLLLREICFYYCGIFLSSVFSPHCVLFLFVLQSAFLTFL